MAFYSGLDLRYSVAPMQGGAIALAKAAQITEKISYSVILTGANDSLSDLPLSARYFNIRKTSLAGEDYCSVSVNLNLVDIDEISARSNGTLKITQQVQYGQGSAVNYELTDLTVIASEVYSGGQNQSLVISGRDSITHDTNAAWAGIAATRIEGKLTGGRAFNIDLASIEGARINPTDSIIINGNEVHINTVMVSAYGDSLSVKIVGGQI